jgi:nicotinic acid mononucleotide adenylyltransferase
VMYRAGFEKPCFCGYKAVFGPERIRKLRQNVISTPLIDISSTKIRQNLSRGLEVQDMVAPAVVDHIKRNHLYSS